MKILLLAFILAGSLAHAAAAAGPVPTEHPAPLEDASAPIEKNDATGKFRKMHASFLARAEEGPIGVLFLGDSITANWVRAPHVWSHYYARLDPANFGIGGDRTQHVVWRIVNGELDHIHPKVVVLMLGTNNTADNTAEQIAEADKKIVRMIREKIPETKVLLLAVFPRGARKNKEGVITPAALADAAHRMAVIKAVNAELAKLEDGRMVRYLDIGDRFLGQDGKIPFPIMPDQLHPSAAGYDLWAEAMQPLLTKMMKE